METHFLILLLTPFLFALLMPVLGRRLGPRVGWIALLAPVISFTAVWLIHLQPPELREAVRWSWIPTLGGTLAFTPDGLALFFGMVVSGVGVLVTFYAANYLDDHYRDHGKFYCYLLLFMGAMLGTVFSSNLLVLFVAWEMTGLTSFLLIGFLHEKEESQRGARMALLTTALTGLVLLAGVVLLHVIYGTFELSEIIAQGVPPGSESMLLAAFLCCFVGIAGKSAQFPFHYWLPNAMAAPTPVSAYLHSATMVKLGVFLTARLLPVFNGLESWTPVLTTVGFGTFLLGAGLALLSLDLKGVLAYTTVAQLGLLIGNYGLYSQGMPVAWDYLHILNHVFYKACLFMVVGIVDHAAGTRDVRKLGGLFKPMPIVGMAAIIGAAALAGLPPTTGFLSKELLLKSVFEYRAAYGGWAGNWSMVTLVAGSLINVIVAAGFVHRVFFGKMPEKIVHHFHAPSFGLQLPPVLLAFGALGGGIAATAFGKFTLSFGVPGQHALVAEDLHLWHGLTTEFLTSAALVIVGIGIYFSVGIKRWAALSIPHALRFDHYFEKVADGTPYAARKLNRLLGFETPQAFLFVTVAAMVAAIAAFFEPLRESWATLSEQWKLWPREPVGFTRWGIVAVVAFAAIAAVIWQKPIRQLFALSIIGAGVTFYFVLYQAPDLALTQIMVESTTLLLVLLVVLRLKREGADQEPMKPLRGSVRALRVVLSVGMGLVLGGGVLFFQQPRARDWAGEFYAQNTLALSKGTNAVNTVVVDFRGWDTLFEITVLVIAALGVLGLLTRRANGRLKKPRGGKADLFPVPSDLILKAVAIFGFVPLNLFALHIFFRGHNLPGGGFIAGLVSALSLLLLVFVIGVHGVRRLLRFDPMTLAVVGVLLALAATLLPTLQGLPLLNHLHWYIGSFYAGTPVLFDLGVFCAVVGVALKLILPLMQSIHGMPAFVVKEEGAFSASHHEPIDLAREEKTDRKEDGV
jgi:NADH:ubiquinone oxidoreductase subunit 5 (subunit L)/multisubunit Na+/H+ antiporter MnhA subunit